MSDLLKRLEQFSPEKRELVLKKLREQQLATAEKNRSKKPRIVPAPRDSKLPLSFAQTRLWFLDQLEGGSVAYNVPAALRLTGYLHVAALEQSIAEMIRRHEVLRTTFPIVNGNPVQRITEHAFASIPILDLQSLSEQAQSSEVQRLAIEDAQRPFDLAQGPLLRVTLLRLGASSHVLLVNLHHIVSDGWSRAIFIREVAILYEAFSEGKPSPLPDLPIQYADFAHWQQQWLTGEVLETQLDYWQKQFSGAPPVLELPTDRPRPPVQTFRGGRETVALDAELTQKLKELSQQSGATLFMTLLAALATLLARYSGQEDIVVGTPIANRNQLELEPLIGFFANTLAIRTDLQQNPTFLELLAQVRQTTLDAYTHQDLPFEKLVEELQPERTLSHNPIFQVMFVLQNIPRDKYELPGGLSISTVQAEELIGKFDLTLRLSETETGLRGFWEYNSDLFDASTIARMVNHFQTLLEGIVVNPRQNISNLSLMTPTEQHRLLVEWNNTQLDYPNNQCIHQLFEEQVDKTPHAIAAVFEDQQLTYQALNSRANQLARHLKALSVGPEVLVGIYAERSIEMVVGVLGILKAGGAYIPLDPTLPRQRTVSLLEDAQVSVLLTQQRLAECLTDLEATVVCLDTDWGIIAQQHEDNLAGKIKPDNLAYVIYTSGSTGQPKGVAVEHRSVLNLLEGLRKTIYSDYQGCQLRVSVNAPLAFDSSIKQIIQLLQGYTLDIVPEALRLDGRALLTFLQSRQIDVFDCTPSHLKLLISAGLLTNEAAPKIVLVGGEPIDESTWATLAKYKNSTFYNVYGPTEYTVDATICNISLAVTKPVIGHPITNTQIFILDQDLQPVPIGVPGELHIGGDGLARGYLNRPELTDARFIPHPFSAQSGTRLYKTGDLARFRDDGNIEFLGRIDRQIKIRGFRIELEEVETVLVQHPQVEQGVVVATGEGSSNQRLVAYIVVAAPSPTPSELRYFLRRRLPVYMVPSNFVTIESLPLTPNGKVDYRALPNPLQIKSESEQSYVPPRTKLEKSLVDIWREILGVDQVGIYDNFFELGGDSLKGAVFINRLQERLNRSVSVVALFDDPTVSGLATYLEKNCNEAAPQIVSRTSTPKTQNLHKALMPIIPIPGDIYPNNVEISRSNTFFKPPFFCVPGVSGNPIYLQALARCLGLDQPFYGLQAPSLDGKSEPYDKVETMAADYIQAIQTVQPQGPYFICGHSSGSRVALEMVRQLYRQGQDIALLNIIDSTAPIITKNDLDYLVDDTAWLLLLAHNIELSTDQSLEMPYEMLQNLDWDEQLNHFKTQLERINFKWISSSTDIAQINGHFQTFKANLKIDRSYHPPLEAIPVKIILFETTNTDHSEERGASISKRMRTKIPQKIQAKRPQEILRDPTRGWGQLSTKPVEIHQVPGTHFTATDPPHVQVLAEKLKDCLVQAQGNNVKVSD
ncbi:MAG: amino acid adenylation domain-containing protein [Leptolyngbyaceae cyanobacterium MO_188.B28]|nr:amino acid adenylation domain-containing protein [Leptolyngbyaceae cyanobacterium MO_188.B28]